jgi:serine/threonine protein kinase
MKPNSSTKRTASFYNISLSPTKLRSKKSARNPTLDVSTKSHRKIQSMINAPKKPIPKNKSPTKIIKLSDEEKNITYIADKIIGTGTFGVVYQSIHPINKLKIAIKTVLQDSRFKNRELEIMKQLSHTNIVSLHSSFITNGRKQYEFYLNLVMEYFGKNLSDVINGYVKLGQRMPLALIKVYSYQMLRALSYCDLLKIVHRDLKPQNLLVDPGSHRLALCDFGSAKKLVFDEPNLAYICSRYYRAPELILGATSYGNSVDMWSAGCVIAEMFIGKPLFKGNTSSEQMVKIIELLGSISYEDILEINPKYNGIKFPEVRKTYLSRFFNYIPSEACQLLEKIFVYLPKNRITPMQALQDPFFDDLKTDSIKLIDGKPLPHLFNWTEVEIAAGLNEIVYPIKNKP